MNLLVLGASGQVGQAVVEQAVERGHSVTALVRNPEKMRTAHEHLETVVGSPLEEEPLTALLRGKDAVLSSLGHRDLKPSSIVSDAAAASRRRRGFARTRSPECGQARERSCRGRQRTAAPTPRLRPRRGDPPRDFLVARAHQATHRCLGLQSRSGCPCGRSCHGFGAAGALTAW